MNRNPGPEQSGHEGTFLQQVPLRDFLNSGGAPAVSFEDGFFLNTLFAAQDECVASELDTSYDLHPLTATNAPTIGYAIPVDIASPLLYTENPVLHPDWGGPFHSPLTHYSLSFSDPISFSLGMDHGNTHTSGAQHSPNCETKSMAPYNNHDHDSFLPNLGRQFDTPVSEILVVANQNPSSWDPDQLLTFALSQGSTSTQRVPPHLIGIPQASTDSAHLESSNTNERQSDQDSSTLDALSLPSFDGTHIAVQQQLPSSPSTLAQSSNGPSESGEAATSLTPERNGWIPSTSSVRLLVAPPGFSHSHILVVTNNAEASSSSLWGGARDAELDKNSKLHSLDIKTQISGSQDSSFPDGSVKKRRMDRRLQPSTSQHVSKGKNVPLFGEAASRVTSPSSYPAPIQASASDHASTASVSSNVLHKRVPKRKADAERQATAQIRKQSACLTCRLMRVQCSDTRPCPRCVRVLQSERAILHVPCQRARLDDVELYRRRTQIGLFIYYYKHMNDQDLPSRTASIVDPSPLEIQLSQSSPLTVADTFELQGFGMFRRFSPNQLNQVDQEKALALQRASTFEDLKKTKVLAQYLDLHITTIIETLGTNNSFIAATLRVADHYSRADMSKPRPKQMLRNALYIFAARFLRRTYWVHADTVNGDYRVAWMDAPWRALPAVTPHSLAEAQTLNGILKDHLCVLERWVIAEYTQKIYGKKREHWFEIFLVTFIFQVILSENLEMSFYSHFPGLAKPIECPWSTFGGLRSYSSKRIASYFSASNGRDPFLKPEARAWEGFGNIERTYLDQCGILLKDGYTKKDDLGFRRSASMGGADSPGSWWKWAVETVLGEGLASSG
ncbi:hypothetical protein QBC36DRAFT_335427 [Triangularia setosa]|uniref:Zn(2)-C6 fungal-type domain-containing protein n=1 Tax=Triangularia setosa TaxID=2587417 RepID=A0AAN7A4D4_9PEZI|nr:hypothetical protein QBC36DRAFT_335427 [Podospora setosa]